MSTITSLRAEYILDKKVNYGDILGLGVTTRREFVRAAHTHGWDAGYSYRLRHWFIGNVGTTKTEADYLKRLRED